MNLCVGLRGRDPVGLRKVEIFSYAGENIMVIKKIAVVLLLISGIIFAGERPATNQKSLRSVDYKSASINSWKRSYPSGQPYSVNYTVNLKVDDLSKAASEVRDLMFNADSIAAGSNDSVYSGRTMKNLSFYIMRDLAEKTVKKLFDLGSLQQYSAYELVTPEQRQETETRIQKITDEMKQNAAALEKMPMATELMTNALKNLKSTRDSWDRGADTAFVNIILIKK
jgi:hypothetical protein